MTNAEMVTAGLAVYGVNWESALARKLGCASSKIHRWTLGTVPMPVDTFVQAVVAKKLKRSW